MKIEIVASKKLEKMFDKVDLLSGRRELSVVLDAEHPKKIRKN